MKRLPLLLIVAATLSACQNWDLLEPASETEASAERSFTRLEPDDPGPLTGSIARQRVEGIRAASGSERLELIETFYADFPEARLLSLVHTLAGEAHLATGDPEAAAVAFRRALELTRTDLLDLPLDGVLPLQLGMSLLESGRAREGIEWLWRAALVDRGERVHQALRWAYAEGGFDEPFASWELGGRSSVSVVAPDFDLPGFQEPRVALTEARGKATIINFWSPT